jgi:aromatic amino acid aminotransferase I
MTISIPFADKSVFIPGYNSLQPDSLLPLAPYTAPSKAEPLIPDLADALSYSATYGAKHLLVWLKESIKRIHAPKYDDWEVCLTAGNTDGTDAVLRTLCNRGDTMLVEEFGEYCSRPG